jgi:hypothetical protein
MLQLSVDRVHRAWLIVVGAAILLTGLAITGLGIRSDERTRADGTVLIAGGAFQASGVVHVPASRQFLFVDDDSPRELFSIEVTPAGQQQGRARSIALGADVTDPEGMTWDGRYFYVVGSQSKPRGFEGDGLVRFTYDGAQRRTERVESIRDIKAWLAQHVTELRGVDRVISDTALNIEGLAWDPVRKRLLLGLRAPVIDGAALLIPVHLADSGGSFSRENLRLAGEAIRLPLGGAGVRSIERDESTGRYWIITGASHNEETRDFHLVEWDGEPGSTPAVRRTFDRRLKPEGSITGNDEAGNRMMMLIFDTGRFLLTREPSKEPGS